MGALEIFFDGGEGAGIVFDESGVGGTAAEGFDSEGTRTCEEIEDAGIDDEIAEAREDSPFDEIHGGAEFGAWGEEGETAGDSCDDFHGVTGGVTGGMADWASILACSFLRFFSSFLRSSSAFFFFSSSRFLGLRKPERTSMSWEGMAMPVSFSMRLVLTLSVVPVILKGREDWSFSVGVKLVLRRSGS